MKLIAYVMGQNADRTIELCFKSLKGVDEIVFVDGGSTDRTLELAKNYDVKVIHNKWDQAKHGMASIQKNLMLEYVKEKYMGDWVLHIDADEIIEDNGIEKIKEFINNKPPYEIYDIKMKHLVYNLRYEDSTRDIHYAPTRLFKVDKDIYYPTGEHVILLSKVTGDVRGLSPILIWHFAYCGGIWDIRTRYIGQDERRVNEKERGLGAHTKEFLDTWRNVHLFGTYPIKKVEPTDLPQLLLSEFLIDKDEIYFANRGIEGKHSIMVKEWNDYFKPESVLDLGCGRGPYLYFWNWYIPQGINQHYTGIELSKWAVNNSFCDKILNGNITDENFYKYFWEDFKGDGGIGYDLITAIDVLEHLTNEDLDKTLKNMSKYGKQFLFSIPFIGDPNLDADPTHIQKKTKEEWIKLIESYGIELEPTQTNWMFHEQILIGKKK